MKPRLLDLFCGAGGAGMGYHRAGFDVAGVDIKPQPNYPFTFVQEDALAFLGDPERMRQWDFRAIHASPPCQAHTSISKWAAMGRPDDRGLALEWKARSVGFVLMAWAALTFLFWIAVNQ